MSTKEKSKLKNRNHNVQEIRWFAYVWEHVVQFVFFAASPTPLNVFTIATLIYSTSYWGPFFSNSPSNDPYLKAIENVALARFTQLIKIKPHTSNLQVHKRAAVGCLYLFTGNTKQYWNAVKYGKIEWETVYACVFSRRHSLPECL